MRRAALSALTRRMISLLAGSPGTMAKRPPRSARAPASVSKRSGLSRGRLVRAVASEAPVREDGSYVAIELNDARPGVFCAALCRPTKRNGGHESDGKTGNPAMAMQEHLRGSGDKHVGECLASRVAR